MFKIHRRVEYALIALKYMRRKFPGQITSAREICDAFQIPFDPTARVLQLLAQNKIIKAEQGPRGGYQIIQDLSKVTLLELSDLLTGPLQIANCFTGGGSKCAAKPVCEIMPALQSLNTKAAQFLNSITLAELVDSPSSEKRRQP